MKGEIGVTRSKIHEIHSLEIQRDQMEGESGVTQGIIDELLSSDIQLDEMKVKVVLLVVVLMNFILRITKDIK